MGTDNQRGWGMGLWKAAVVVFLGAIALRPVIAPPTSAQAQTARFDHVTILSTVFLYKGQQGLLLLDRRNGNIWFVPRKDENFLDPVFVRRMEFEKLDQAPR